MDEEAVVQAVTQIMREYFDDDSLVLTRDTTAEDVPAWDSMNHVSVIVAIEQHFKIRFITAELEGLHNVGALVDLIQTKLKSS